MKAVVIDQLGGVPELREVPDPVAPEGGEVARVRAAAIKNIERMLVAGSHYGSGQMSLPAQVGLDAVVQLADGRRVYTGATPPAGAMAEYLAVRPEMVAEVPDGVPDAVAAALPNAAVSAWFSLEHAAGVQPGAAVLVLGATGVTGALAVQLAKHQFGAGQVTAVGRDEARLHSLADQGADRVIRIGDLSDLGEAVRAVHTDRPIDVVLDYVWGPPAEQVLGALGNEELAAGFHRTRYVQIGEGAGATIELPAAVLRSAGVELVGQGAGSVPKEAFARVLPEILPTLFELLDRGVLGVQTVERPLAGVADAWLEPTSSGVRTVLVP
ncbi:MAG TPA: zinc-binding alcohol dehydrogenase family protein [Ruania sp.]|nr:zinc-binding alcohol dehydrogenase family protein [Ruania sp.]